MNDLVPQANCSLINPCQSLSLSTNRSKPTLSSYNPVLQYRPLHSLTNFGQMPQLQPFLVNAGIQMSSGSGRCSLLLITHAFLPQTSTLSKWSHSPVPATIPHHKLHTGALCSRSNGVHTIWPHCSRSRSSQRGVQSTWSTQNMQDATGGRSLLCLHTPQDIPRAGSACRGHRTGEGRSSPQALFTTTPF